MGNKRILVVDYDPKSLSHTRDILQTAGFEVAICSDGLSALDHFRSMNPDLVLLSAMLPKMHGFEVCSNIRKIPGGEKTPVVIITDVYKGKRYRLDAMNKYGATEYIEKPIEDSNLVSILQNLIQKNGAPTQVASALAAEDIDETTMRFSPEDIKQAIDSAEKGIPEKPMPVAPLPKKPERQRSKVDDDIDKKLEESLAGLSLDFSRGALAKLKSKSKPAPSAKPANSPGGTSQPLRSAPPAVNIAPQPQKQQVAASSAVATSVASSATAARPEDSSFTSEDLFNDVIASVEQELEYEKFITDAGIKQKTGAVEPKQAPASSFDEELERKINDTLSGILKGKPSAAAAAAKSAPPVLGDKKVEESASPTMQLSPEEVQGALSAAATQVEGINFGQYLLLSKIATGGMAELFKAKRKGVEGFEKILAIKRILPHMSDNEEFITMFIDEAKLAAQLTHHNVCQIFDLGKIDNSYYIAMEYVHGKDLRAVLRAARTREKEIPVELGILITSKICSALDYAHRKKNSNGQPLNLVHRDVSPQNILISYEGDVKLVDFGIAKAATKVHVTQHGALKGKLLYMSPEQAWGKAVDRRSDIFSVCAVLYEMLAGRPLFFEENDIEVTILEKVREAQITPICSLIPTLPQELEKILTKGLQKNPDDRYQVASDMQKDLDNLFYTEGYNATSASLASFARSLFPEEWVHEPGGRATLVISKDVSDQIKTKLAEKDANAKSTAATLPPTVTQPTAPQPAVLSSPSKQLPAAAQTSPPTEVSKTGSAPIPAAPQTESLSAKAQTVPTPAPTPTGQVTSPTHQISTVGFRDISTPGIMPPQQTSGNFVKFLIAGIIFAAIVGGLLFFLYRPPAPQNLEQNTPQQTQKRPDSPTVTDFKNPPVSTQNPATSVKPTPETEQQKMALLKLMEEQKKKADALKEEQKKKEEQAKLDEQKKLEEQMKLDETRKKEEEARRAEELTKAEVERALEEQRQKEAAAAAEQARLAQLQQQQTPAPTVSEEPASTPPAEVQQEPVVNEGDLVELTPDVIKPVLVKKVEPEYPRVAMQKKIEGTVILQLLVNEDGQVSDVQVLRTAGGSGGLNEAAVSAVRQWTFRPAVKAGKRVKVRVTYPIVFKLQ